ncbi:aldo/keto reductase [Candidatus Halobonum tyrrellensis]|uniref:2,5-diketo-D-gluconate reductase B n=1 Tax=Candidatus Halobonum tyrrellensis G22 TaxID=1324957 RepID=V4IYF2_9EURY|nr:aldo/keto reductase [Candidatus Halobonum tyrrellensis]ESP88172.1 2,5-diketo-D-gluconate reductase B [Candidatus Halobonum tyrrellensis G22]
MAEFQRFGEGTYLLPGTQCTESVATALDAGYEMVDTAQGYQNEALVRRGVERSGSDMDDTFVATKLDTGNLAYDDAVATAHESAARLGVDTIDLLYVHWPLDTYDAAETCRALDELVDDGVVDRIGLSNFRPDQLDEARDHLDAPVFAHQVECHPLLQQEELREYAVENDHWLVAYSPIARNEVAEVDEIRDVAEAHDATPAQVSIAWLLTKENVAAIPKATSEEHIRDNLAALDVDLTDEEVERIDDIDREERLVDFDAAPWNDAEA